MDIKIKICGITRATDLQFCKQEGVDFTGFIFHPKSPRYITPKKAGQIKGMEGGRVGVFVNQSTGEIQDMAGAACIDFIQLHGGQDADFCSAFPKKKLIKVFWPEKYSCVAELKNDMDIFAPLCRYFLLDAGSGGGGHGRRIDSLLISEFITRKKTFMAGGLDPGNIKSALSRKPFAVDINSGVEKYPGIKDHKLIIELIKNIKTLCTID